MHDFKNIILSDKKQIKKNTLHDPIYLNPEISKTHKTQWHKNKYVD